MMRYSIGSVGTQAPNSALTTGVGMMGGVLGIASGMTPGSSLGLGMMGSNSMADIMQGILNGSATGSTPVTGMMQGMLDVMDDFLPGNASTNPSNNTNVFQTMASAMNLAFTGSATAPASFQTMLDTMHGFLSNAASGSSNASGSFQTMLDSMQTFLSTEVPGSSNASGPFNTMLDTMQIFLSSTTSGSPNASSSFQTMLGAMQTVLNDTNMLSGPASAHSLSIQADGSVQLTGTDGIPHVLANMQRLHFTDVSVALDINGDAGQAYRLYQAAFDRQPDTVGLGYWIAGMDKGVSLEQVATAFLNSSEFTNLYGSNPTTEQFVSKLYGNVLHRAPDQAGHDWWVNAINNGGMSKAQALMGFSESTENHVALIGIESHGIDYTPFTG